MASNVTTVETHHQDMIHDAQLDYYSKMLATCSSDRLIKIFSADEPRYPIATISQHQGPVWAVQWAHPKFGVLLASASYDRTVMIHREVRPGAWETVKVFTHHESSVNSIKWAPHQYGLQLACASSDGTVSVLAATDASGANWAIDSIQVSNMGVNSVDWAPHGHLGQSTDGGVQRLVAGACDNTVRIYRRDATHAALHTLEKQQSQPQDPAQDAAATGGAAGASSNWVQDGPALAGHTDWVRGVAWAPTTGLLCNAVASCSEDGTAQVHTQSVVGGPWTSRVLHQFEGPVWTVSWSLTGNILAVAAGTSDISLWKESLAGSWERVSSAEDDDDKAASSMLVGPPAAAAGTAGAATAAAGGVKPVAAR
jgi:protein transport protein SEC13